MRKIRLHNTDHTGQRNGVIFIEKKTATVTTTTRRDTYVVRLVRVLRLHNSKSVHLAGRDMCATIRVWGMAFAYVCLRMESTTACDLVVA